MADTGLRRPDYGRRPVGVRLGLFLRYRRASQCCCLPSPVVGRLSRANVSAFSVDKDSTNSLSLKRDSTVGSTSRRGEYIQTVRYEEMSGKKMSGESDQTDTIATCRRIGPLCSATQLLLDFEKFSLFVITVCEWLHPLEILIQYSHRAHGCRREDHLMSSLFAQTHKFAVQQTSFKWLSLYLERITVLNYHTGGFSAESLHSIAFLFQFSFVWGSFQTLIYFFLTNTQQHLFRFL